MVDPAELDELDVYRDPESGRLVARDPEEDEIIPTPFGETVHEAVTTEALDISDNVVRMVEPTTDFDSVLSDAMDDGVSILLMKPGVYRGVGTTVYDIELIGLGHRSQIELFPEVYTDAFSNMTFERITFAADGDHDEDELLRTGPNVTFSKCHFTADPSNPVRYFLRLPGDDCRFRGCSFGDSDEFTDNDIRIDGDGFSITNCTNLTSVDDRGTDNVTAGNSPLDVS